MKRAVQEIILTVLIGILIPWIFVGTLYVPEPEPSETTAVTTEPTRPKRVTIPVYTESGQTVEMELTEYLTGVLLCEIPANFHPQAKMAQAVVARTYALRTVAKGVKHDPAAVCTNSACCQGYKSPQTYLTAGGTEEAVEQAREAVEATAGYVLTYGGQLIDATYFSCSGGETESALAVWGSDIPYLQSVQSPGEEHASHYTDTVSYTAEAFRKALGTDLSGKPGSWFGAVTYTEGGGVESMQIGGVTYKGTTLRKLLSLRSTAFSVTTTSTSVVITTKGFGHRVGMSQYGADAMASAGCSFAEILEHYYTGAVIDKGENLG